MPLIVNLPQLNRQTIRAEGRIDPAELSWDREDELLRWGGDLSFRLTIRRLGDVIRLEGALEVDLDCECARCLKPFRRQLRLDPWECEVPLEGEDAVAVDGDLVDLTPFLREDTVLALPKHPLCDPGCSGLASGPPRGKPEPDVNAIPRTGASTWSVLDRLKF